MSLTTRYAPIAALMLTDCYKLDHRRVYELAGHTTRVYSNYTNRGSRIPGVDHVVHFGLQAAIQKINDMFDDFFNADEDEVCALYEERTAFILGPNDIGSDHIRALHRLGYLPLEIKALPEGTPAPVKVPVFTIENTEDEFFWLTNYLETALSAEYWQASTSATIAHTMRWYLDRAAVSTGANMADVDFQSHDFSYRGMSSTESASASGAGHLLSFKGTDSLPALEWIDRYYGGTYDVGSVPATEHSVMCSGTAVIGEKILFKKLITELYPTGIFSVVSDTFDLWTVLTDFLPTFHDEIMARDGRVVIRPDSGNPVDILCGTLDWRDPDQKAEYDARKKIGALKPAEKGVVELLADEFGTTVNDFGYEHLDPHVGAIYGDSITLERAKEINARLAAKGFDSTNVVFGVGSFTYQYNARDTFMSAIKATWAEVDGVGYDLQKDPVTDDGTKKSAKGRLAVVRSADGGLELLQQATPDQEVESLLKTVWRNGAFIRFQSFDDVRQVLRNSGR